MKRFIVCDNIYNLEKNEEERSWKEDEGVDEGGGFLFRMREGWGRIKGRELGKG